MMETRFCIVEQEGSDITLHVPMKSARILRRSLADYEFSHEMSKFHDMVDLDDTKCTVRLDRVVLIAEITEDSVRRAAERREYRMKIEREEEGWSE